MLTAQIHGKWQSFGGVFFDFSAKLLNIFKNGCLGNYSYKQLTRHSNGQITVGFRSCLTYFSQLSFAA